jgi:hypothetical protein
MEAWIRLTNLVAAIAAAFTVAVLAQGPATKALPLDNLGLEHLDIVVRDPAASAAFYSRVFKSALHQQPGSRRRASRSTNHRARGVG